MLQAYSKRVILFPAGASGHFLATFLAANPQEMSPTFRIDFGQHSATAVKFCNTYDDIVTELETGNHLTILSHCLEVSKLKTHPSHPKLYKIYPKTNVFGWIKNVHYKKQLVEYVDYSAADFVMRVDMHIMNIHDFYTQINLDNDIPDELTVDFGQLYNIEYLTDLYKTVNQKLPSQDTINFASDYVSKQFPPLEDCLSKDLIDIVKHVNPQDLFDLAIVIFIYEKNHNTVDKNRLWSIDDLPNTVPASIEFLLKNEKNYTIFKEANC